MVLEIILAGFEKLIYFAYQMHIIFFWINYIFNLQFFSKQPCIWGYKKWGFFILRIALYEH